MKRLIFPALAMMVAIGCGGGGTSAPIPPPTRPITDTHVWAGVVHSNGTGQNYVVNAILLPNGTFRYASINYVMAYGTFTSSGGGLTGAGTMLYPSDSHNWTIGANVSVSCSGSSSSVSGTFTSPADTGTISLAAVPSANTNVDLASLTGTYSDDGSSVSNGLSMTITVSANGAIAGSTTAGSFSGQLTQDAPSVNAFRLTLHYSDGSAQSPYTYEGAAFLDTSTSRIYLQGSDPRAYGGGMSLSAMFIASARKTS